MVPEHYLQSYLRRTAHFSIALPTKSLPTYTSLYLARYYDLEYGVPVKVSINYRNR